MQTTNTVTLPVTRSTFIAGSVALIIVVALLSAFLSATIAVHSIPKPPVVDLTPLRQQLAYSRVVTLNYTLLVAHYNRVSDTCGVQSDADCEAALKLLNSSTTTFLSDLGKAKAPACLTQTNNGFIEGLRQVQAGSDQALMAFQTSNVDQATSGGEQMAKGMSYITQAEDNYAAAAC